jgi:hypothetical protein
VCVRCANAGGAASQHVRWLRPMLCTHLPSSRRFTGHSECMYAYTGCAAVDLGRVRVVSAVSAVGCAADGAANEATCRCPLTLASGISDSFLTTTTTHTHSLADTDGRHNQGIACDESWSCSKHTMRLRCGIYCVRASDIRDAEPCSHSLALPCGMGTSGFTLHAVHSSSPF